MPDPPVAPELERPTPENPERHLPEDFGPGLTGRLLFWIAVAFAAFQVVTAFGIPINRDLAFGVTLIHLAGIGFLVWAGHTALRSWRGGSIRDGLAGLLPMLVSYAVLAGFGGGVPSQVLRTIHVGFLCLLAAGMLAQHRVARPLAKALWWGLGGAAFLAGLYHWEFYRELVTRAGHLTGPDLVVGVVAVVV